MGTQRTYQACGRREQAPTSRPGHGCEEVYREGRVVHARPLLYQASEPSRLLVEGPGRLLLGQHPTPCVLSAECPLGGCFAHLQPCKLPKSPGCRQQIEALVGCEAEGMCFSAPHSQECCHLASPECRQKLECPCPRKQHAHPFLSTSGVRSCARHLCPAYHFPASQNTRWRIGLDLSQRATPAARGRRAGQ